MNISSPERAALFPTEAVIGIQTRLARVQEQVKTALLKAGRSEEAAVLVAVSKTHPPEAILAALAAGQRIFGENKVQEALGKFPALRDKYPDLRLHLIGGLQTNKAEAAHKSADYIQTLDRPSLLEALRKAEKKNPQRPHFFIEVNTGNEVQKAGIRVEEAPDFIDLCRASFGDRIKGLMCIPPNGENPVPHFRLLARLAAKKNLQALSMGMSADFEIALAEGATCVRVGSAIFGHRT